MLVCAVYLWWRCLLPLRIPRWCKGVLGALIVLCAYKLQIFRALFPGLVVPEIPSWALILSGWVFAVVILWSLLSLTWDATLLMRRLVCGARCSFASARAQSAEAPVCKTEPRHGRRVALLLVGAVLLASLGVWQAVRVPPVRTVELPVAFLPPALDGLRVVQLSDLHISPLFRAAWSRAVVDRVNALRPDLVVLTGDMIDGSAAQRTVDVAPLADLRARYGVWGCLGNHEYYSGRADWLEAFAGLGVRMLVNSYALVEVKEGDATATLVLGGVADPSGAKRETDTLRAAGAKRETDTLRAAGAKRETDTLRAVGAKRETSTFRAAGAEGGEGAEVEGPDVAAAFADSPHPASRPDVLRLLLAHQPRSGGALAAAQGVGLQLSGHTHGGQIFPVSEVVALFNQGYLAGEYVEGDTTLYVSRGVGLWGGFPLRLGAPAEITEIILRPRAAAGANPAR